MNISKFFTTFLISLALSSASAEAAAIAYRVTSASDGTPGTGITFAVTHTAGVHHGKAGKVTGLIEAEWGAPTLSGKLAVPIDSMQTGNDKRDCHMREALGIDYAHSKFPNEHVCDSQNQLPSQGDDSIHFGTVELELLSLRRADDRQPVTLEPGKTVAAFAKVRWTIHGISLEGAEMPLNVTFASDASGKVQIDLESVLKLSDFGVVVKPFLLITVKDEIHLSIHSLLSPETR